MITEAEIKHIAQLARLELSAAEIKLYADQLSTILDYVHQLSEVDTSSLAVNFGINEEAEVWRSDEVKNDKSGVELPGPLVNGQLKAPRILE